MVSASAAAATAAPMILLLLVVVVHLQIHLSAAAAGDDVRCLRGFRDALSDPNGLLTSWNFANSTVGFVCSFTGVTCWNNRENRVLSLSLPSSSLSGPLPPSLQYCASLNNLDLNSNSLSGPIPANLCSWLPFVVNLDLSSNSFTGPLPPSLSDCKFLNTLYLSSNQLSGPIPASLSALDRLKKFDVSSNRLSGPIPASLSHFPSSSFDDNPSLCGNPVSSSCSNKPVSRTSLIIIAAAGVFGAAVSLLIAYLVWRCCFSASAQAKKHAAGGAPAREDGRWWSDRLRTSHHRLVPVSLFQQPLVKVKLADLMTATRDFHPDYIVTAGSARVGTSYEAVLPDGSALTVKRLHGCPLSEKQFRAEMSRIGQLRHPNLVPLLGFCVVEDERLLIYKHMPTGALSTAVRSRDAALDWPTRLRIGAGAARGLAWLHHGSQVPFLHQNVSSDAVLLDEDYEPRITDFGLARLVRSAASEEDGANTTPFLNRDFGEFGYVAPEYSTNPVATAKGDVYSFGVVLLELATGQKAVEVSSDVAGDGFKGNLVDWVNQLSVSGRLSEAIDKSLRGKGHDVQIVDFLKIACGCVVARPKERPTMFHVYHSLKSIGSTNTASEQFDEFPLVYGKDGPEAA